VNEQPKDNTMDVNVLRSLTTLLMFGVFIGIVVWAMAGRRRAEFDAAAQLPFAEQAVEPSADASLSAAADRPATRSVAGLPAAGAQGEKQ
jgi:cytochrome c oxidase cbb3-type subunit 4